MEDTYSLQDLNRHIKQVIGLNFPEPIWIKAEIAQANQSRGHTYLELVEKESTGTIAAQASAVLWKGKRHLLDKKTKHDVGELLQAGREIKLLAQVEFHERYGLKLILEDLDDQYTLGKLEQQRLETLGRLRQLGLMDKNARLPLPSVLQHIAVISSPTAAGWADFQDQLSSNPYGYAFEVQLFPAAMQGEAAVSEMVKQLEVLAKLTDPFDAVLILRGGGSRLDLAVFDHFDLSRSVAELPIPVITGIGHEIDISVVDGVAHSSLKTPTAVADMLVDHNLAFETKAMDLGVQAQYGARRSLELQLHRVRESAHALDRALDNQITQERRLLDYIKEQLGFQAKGQQQRAELALLALQKEVESLDPTRVLEKGYALVWKDHIRLRTCADVELGDQIAIRLRDGTLSAEIKGKPE